MGLLDNARRDVKRFRGGEFSTPITFKANGSTIPEDTVINGTATEHAFLFDDDGRLVVSNNASITVNESTLNEANIVTRNADNQIVLKDFVIQYADNVGAVGSFHIKHILPNKTLGDLVCILGGLSS